MFKDIRVLDLTRLLPGPYTTLMLADMGAEVIKVEDTDRGDYMRLFPPLVKEDSAYYLALNRNKKSISIDLKSPQGKEIFLDLARTANVVVESFRPGVVERLGIGYGELKKVNPKVILCSLTGYGQEGPYRNKAGHDINYMALSGILGLTGRVGERPVIPAVQTADVTGGLLAALGIAGALHRQSQTGKGCYIDVAMLDGLLSLFAMHFGRFFATGAEEQRGGMALSGGQICYNAYATSDGRYVALAALEEKFWVAFCRGINREDLVGCGMSPAVEGNEAFAELKKIFAMRTFDEWAEFAADFDCCLTPILSTKEVFENEQVKARKAFSTLEHAFEGTTSQVSFPIKLNYSDVGQKMLAPPRLGEHTAEILGEMGVSENELGVLVSKGIVKIVKD